MTYTLQALMDLAFSTSVETKGGWVPVRPISGGLRYRLKSAWLVIIGKADAVVWPSNQ